MTNTIWNESEMLGLIERAKGATLDTKEQVTAGYALEYYRSAALRLERAVHSLVKQMESIDEV